VRINQQVTCVFSSISGQCAHIIYFAGNIMLKQLTALTVFLSSLLTAVQPAIATSTEPIQARCIWIEHGKQPIQQTCTVTGNSGGTGAGFIISWQDGLKTKIWCAIDGGCKSEGSRKADLFNQVERSRMGFPRAIVLEDLGVITIDY
jgi:hypothetical protein